MDIGSCRVSTDDHKAWTTSSSMKTCVFTPPHAQVYAWPPSSSTLEAMIHAWGAKARGRRYPPGPMVFRPLRVKEVFWRFDWESDMCVAWTWAIFVMPVDFRSRRSTMGCRWSLELEAW